MLILVKRRNCDQKRRDPLQDFPRAKKSLDPVALENKFLYTGKLIILAKDVVQCHTQVVCKDLVCKARAQPLETSG